MARQKKPVHRVQMTEGKRNIIHTSRRNPLAQRVPPTDNISVAFQVTIKAFIRS